MSSDADPKHDAAFEKAWKACQKAHIPALEFINRAVAFVGRKSDFLGGSKAQTQIRSVVSSHATAAKKRIREKTQKSEKAKPAPVVKKKKKTPEPPNKFKMKPTATIQTPVPASKPTPTPDSKPAGGSEVDNKEEDDEPKKGPKPVGNGGTTDNYVWTQTLDEVEVNFKVPPYKGRDFDVVITKKRLKVGVKGQPPIVDGEFTEDVKVDDSTWSLVSEAGSEKKLLTVLLTKVKGMGWWSGVLKGDPEIVTQDIEPESSKLSDLDGETRQTVEKMMFDQRQKQMGLPTSKEQEQQNMMKKFMAAHPEMDFSQCNFGGSQPPGFPQMG